MMECWSQDPNDRPTFEQLYGTFVEIAEENVRPTNGLTPMTKIYQNYSQTDCKGIF